ncbi:MAG: hypothetical protein AB1861_22195, partial [Cyanobacteriota bacterium]
MNEQIKVEMPTTADAKYWAKEFVRIVKGNPSMALDEQAMLFWFAHAIMAGFDLAKSSGRRNNAIDRLRESLASQQHEIWAHWMRYQFGCCVENSDGS